jgi:hypothetical protein
MDDDKIEFVGYDKEDDMVWRKGDRWLAEIDLATAATMFVDGFGVPEKAYRRLYGPIWNAPADGRKQV